MDDGISVIDRWEKNGHERCRRWFFRVWDDRRRSRKSKAFADGKKDEGWAWAKDQRALISQGMASSGRMPLAIVAADYIAGLKERGLAERYREEVDRVAKAAVAAGATDLYADTFATSVRTWLATAPSFTTGRDSPGPVTRNRWLVELKMICKHAVIKHGLRSNPLAGVRRFKVDQTIKTTMRLDELRPMVAEWKRSDPYYLPACSMVYAGLRIGEAMHLRWEWIDREARTITLRVIRDAKGKVAWAPKRNKERIIPLQRELDEILFGTEAKPIERPATGWVVAKEQLRELEDKNQWKAFRAYLGRCGLDPRDLSPHCTRHTWTALMLASGASPSLVRRALGHTSLATTDGYADAESAYTTAVKGWERGEFQLRRRPKAALPAPSPAMVLDCTRDPMAFLREYLHAGGTIEQLAAASEVPAATLKAWFFDGAPEDVRRYLSAIAACATMAVSGHVAAAPRLTGTG